MPIAEDRDRPDRLRVGILGAGPVTQAIHLPTLARLSEDFEIRLVMDVQAETAETVAQRAGARYATRAEDVFADSSIDVIVVCSPPQFHAAQVIAACRAGVKAVLCEKPLATTIEQAHEIAEVSRETGVPIVVGAMHTFDPAWLAAEADWGDLAATAHTIRSSIVLPPNARFEDLATDIAVSTTNKSTGVVDQARAITDGIMELAIHDLPLIRRFLPTLSDLEVLQAELTSSWGYVISGTVSEKVIHLQASLTEGWAPQWTLEAVSDELSLMVAFTPSYVLGGSAVATLNSSAGSRTYGPFALSGYEAEWLAIARMVRGQQAAPPLAELVDDLRFAITLADQSAHMIRTKRKLVG